MNYEADIEIDPEGLDVEWLKQPRLMFRYAKLAAEARDKISRLEEKLECWDARKGLRIRKDPSKYGLDSVTEKGITSVLLSDETHMEISKEISDAKFEQDVLSAAVRALDAKKSALENMVRLHGQNYFSGPKVPHNIGKEWEKDMERTAARGKIKNRKRGEEDN